MAATLDDLELEFTEVRLGSVAKITAFFGLATLALWFGATLFFWAFASSAGLISSFEQLVRDIGFEGFRIEAGPVFLAIALVGAVCVVSLLTVVLVATASYNAFAAFFGGLRCVVAPRSLADTSASTTGANTTDPNTTDESHASVRSDDAAPAREP